MFFLAKIVFLQQGCVAFDCRNWGLEFVGYIDYKIIAESLNAAQLLNHNIKVMGYVADLVDPVRFIQINVEVAFGNFIGRFAEIFNRG
ncbi:hypothetical protein D3C73_1348480 [compost metagenome]